MRRLLSAFVLGLGAVALALGAGAAGYALNAATSATQHPAATESPPTPEPSSDDTAPERPDPGPFGNAAGLSYTRLAEDTFLVVLGGEGVAALTARSASGVPEGVALEFTAEYVADEGELAVRSRDFFTSPGLTPAGPGDFVYPERDEQLARLTPQQPVQDFTVVLPDAPERGAVSYAPSHTVDPGLDYRTPLCYEVGAGFSPHREECEQ